MKISSILVCITMVGIAIEICKAKYLLVEIDDAKNTGKLCCILSCLSLFKKLNEFCQNNYCNFRYLMQGFSIDTSSGNVTKLNRTADQLKESKVPELAKENMRSEGNQCSLMDINC